MKSVFYVALAGCLLLSGGCAFFGWDVVSYGQQVDGFDDGLVAFNTSDYNNALRLMTPPAENGNVDAQYLIGMIYLHGLSSAGRNSYLAEKWLTMAAGAGHTAAQVQLAFLYKDPTAPLYNPLAAYRWFDIVVGERPQYKEMLDSLHWTLLNQGLLAQAEELDIVRPKYVYYRGMDYNDLFPPR